MKITRLAVAAAAVSLTLVGTGVAQADTTKEHTTTEATATAEASSEESSSQSSSLSSTDENVDSDKDGDKDDAKEQDEFEQPSSQAIEDNSRPIRATAAGYHADSWWLLRNHRPARGLPQPDRWSSAQRAVLR